jgi:hypothetical protein
LRKRLRSVEDAEHTLARVEASLDEIREQRRRDGRVLG